MPGLFDAYQVIKQTEDAFDPSACPHLSPPLYSFLQQRPDRPGAHIQSSPRTSVTSVPVTGHDLGVTLDTLSSPTFCSYLIYSQVLSILLATTTQIHLSPSASVSSTLVQTVRASHTDFLLLSGLCSHAPHISQGKPLQTYT